MLQNPKIIFYIYVGSSSNTNGLAPFVSSHSVNQKSLNNEHLYERFNTPRIRISKVRCWCFRILITPHASNSWLRQMNITELSYTGNEMRFGEGDGGVHCSEREAAGLVRPSL